MTIGNSTRLIVAIFAMGIGFVSSGTKACCPVRQSGREVVNADQTVIIVWDAATKTEYFIRQASFESDADDFGFIIPTPTQPALDESGNEAFGFLAKLTAPEIIRMQAPSGGMGCGCSKEMIASHSMPVRVLEEKTVAGFSAVVLEADSSAALVKWLKENGYAFSPEVEAWAKPYVDAGWKMTALKVAKPADLPVAQSVAAPALRMSFKTDRPLFPYREPDPRNSAKMLGVSNRLLRIYFLSDARYSGDLDGKSAWTGTTAWTNPCSRDDWASVVTLLKLPQTIRPATGWLTEFEDHWPYQIAPGDLYFSQSALQQTVKRPPIVQYVSAAGYSAVIPFALALGVVVFVPRSLIRARHRRSR